MSTLIAIVGSRGYPNLAAVEAYVNGLDVDDDIITGGARGVDTAAADAGYRRWMHVHIVRPEWSRLGKAAGPIRNTEIVERCDFLVAFWDGTSPGTRDVVEKARRAGKLHAIIGPDGEHLP